MIRNLLKNIKIKNFISSRKNTEEYNLQKLVSLTRGNLNTQEWMKRDWNARAETCSKFFIRAVKGQTEEEFWESGKIEPHHILGVDTPRYELIFKNKDVKEMKVLEIGCGIGRILIPISKIFGEAIGVDVSKKMISIANEYVKEIPNCQVFENNGKDLSMFPDNYFDFCFSFIVFQHIPEKEIVVNYIRDVSRILKKECLFRFQVHGDSKKNPVDGTTWHGVHFTSNEMHKIADENNFEIIEEDGMNDQYYWLTFKSIK